MEGKVEEEEEEEEEGVKRPLEYVSVQLTTSAALHFLRCIVGFHRKHHNAVVDLPFTPATCCCWRWITCRSPQHTCWRL